MTVGVSSISLLYSFNQPNAPSRNLRKLVQSEVLIEIRSNLVEENLREKSRQRRRFQSGPSLDAANHCEQTRPHASAWRRKAKN